VPLYFPVLLNSLTAISEINSLYAQRPIVEKHSSYTFYHPATEAIAGVVADIPVKFFLAAAFNVIIYFHAGLRREPRSFFLRFLGTFLITLVMSDAFHILAAVTRTV
jgi:ABC-type multidrug transport system permease subunit